VTTFMVFIVFALPSFWIGTLAIVFCVAAISSTSFLRRDDSWGTRDLALLAAPVGSCLALMPAVLVMSYGGFAGLSALCAVACLKNPAGLCPDGACKGLSEHLVI